MYSTPTQAKWHHSFWYIEKKSTITTQSADSLKNILRTPIMDIIFGDFNINYFDEFGIVSLKQLMNYWGCIQIINKPTFVSAGSLLNQVYVNQFLSNKVQNEVNSVYNIIQIMVPFKLQSAITFKINL